MHQTCKGTKKIKKKLQFPGTMGPLLSSCWNFCFFWCLSMFCEVRVTKPAQAPKKPKKLKFPGTMGPLLSSCWNFCFFWFFWCLCRFGASSGLVFLVPINVLWSQSHQTCTGTKKTKKNKPLDAPNLKISRNYGSTSVVAGIFVFFGLCWCLSMFGASSGLVFLVPVNVLWSQSHQTCTGTKKTKKTKPLDAPNLHRHQKNKKK